MGALCGWKALRCGAVRACGWVLGVLGWGACAGWLAGRACGWLMGVRWLAVA